MIIQGVPIGTYSTDCPYISGNSFESENILMKSIDGEGLDHLLSYGFRHFGHHFFRPICTECHQCIPIRVSAKDFVPSRSLRRVYAKGENLRYMIGGPEPSEEKFALYLAHTERFEEKDTVTYESFVESFFHPFPFSRELRIYDGDRLIAVSHYDTASTSLSAVYCYWDATASDYSPGTLAILKELEVARAQALSWVYLGYYVPENRHMNYKARFRPNELLLSEEKWIPFCRNTNRSCDPALLQQGFQALGRLVWE